MLLVLQVLEFTLLFQLIGQLADRRGLAHAVDADDQNDAGLGGQVQSAVAHFQLLGQDLPQSALHLVCRQQTVKFSSYVLS